MKVSTLLKLTGQKSCQVVFILINFTGKNISHTQKLIVN